MDYDVVQDKSDFVFVVIFRLENRSKISTG